ncbi:MAG TPA: hypothetical protein VLL98_00190 [Rickettsiales bacterium]|nr:hypothetical protein [Rickettsiales bacterium]
MNSIEIKIILDNLRNSMIEANKNNGVAEYSLNTGQTVTRVVYNTEQLLKQIQYWERKYNEAIQEEKELNVIIIRDENV